MAEDEDGFCLGTFHQVAVVVRVRVFASSEDNDSDSSCLQEIVAAAMFSKKVNYILKYFCQSTL